MKVYNKEKTQILEEYDLEKGFLKEDTIITHYAEIEAVEEQFHYETIREYANGGKDVRKVIDVAGVEYQPARDEAENIYIYIAYTEAELKEKQIEALRNKREAECFTIVNRGQLWYNSLTDEQINELNIWYQAWLDVTETLTEPEKPEWLK